MSFLPSRSWVVPALAAIAALLAGCAQNDGAINNAPAPLKAVGFATDIPNRAGFVEGSRPETTDFIPVGVTPPARPLTPRKAGEVDSLKQELESTRSRLDALGGRQPGATSTLADDMKKTNKTAPKPSPVP